MTELARTCVFGALESRSGVELKQKPKKSTKVPRNLTDANKRLLGFPNEIPGAARVVKFYSPGATKIGVHIRQIHDHKGSNEEYKQEVRQVHANISEILKFLHFNEEVDSVYSEGVTVKEERELNKTLSKERNRRLRNILRSTGDYQIQHFFSPKLMNEEIHIYDAEAQQRLRSEEPTFPKDSEKQKKLRLEAAEQVATNYPVAVRGTDTDVVLGAMHWLNLMRATSFGRMTEEQEFVTMNFYLNKREDLVLDLLAANEEEMSVIVYGAGHQFADSTEENMAMSREMNAKEKEPIDLNKYIENNVQKWNDENEDEKFSWIEITPEGLY